MGPQLCLAVVWAVWTTEPTLNRNEEGPDFFRAFVLVLTQQSITHDFGQISVGSKNGQRR